MPNVVLPLRGTDCAWRDAARGLIAQNCPPADILWRYGAAGDDLFADAPIALPKGRPLKVSKAFVDMANTIVWHSDPQRFARLYALLWRLRDRPRLMADRGDRDVATLRAMEKAVNRDKHKMKAFLRFREIDPLSDRRRFAAWFEPSHFITEPLSQSFFAPRFGDMDWVIVTPHLTAHFTNGHVTFADGQTKPPLPEDATEQLWTTYFRNIFNPARLKIKAMQAEMPKKYWKNMPEAAAIPELIAGAEARAKAMQEAAPTLPPLRAERIAAHAARPAAAILAQTPPPGDLLPAIKACTKCPLHRSATQAVPGQGPLDAPLMIVGEQPGDHEDLAGRPFVGPAGQMFDQIAAEIGLDRSRAYITNAVKHFKFTPRGKRRIHAKPNADEIEACKWWLDAEIQTVQPQLILAMGATAAAALTGSGTGILKRRGTIEARADGTPILLTLHPSYLLRVPDPGAKAQAIAAFRADLAMALAKLRELAV